MKKKILLVFGTRPEAIKMAPLIKEFQKNAELFKTIVCVTGQHREMLDQVLNLFEIFPEYDLNLMKPGQDLYDITSGVLLGMREVLKKSKPDIVLVHGDTCTSTATALSAFYQQIPVGHVEAGLRTYNIYSPWPEEMNRQITSRIAKYHFCPTETSRQNLLREGINENLVFVTGNTVIDALYWILDKFKSDPELKKEVEKSLIASGLPPKIFDNGYNKQSGDEVPENLKKNTAKKIVLITGHRRENFGEGFINICEAIRDLAEFYPEINFIYPMHLNPNVRKPIKKIFGDLYIDVKNSNVHFIEPLDYLPFVYIMSKSYIILTDSGGIQEEAPSLGKPVLVMRDTTERPESLKAGTVKLVGTDKKIIFDNVSKLLTDNNFYKNMTKSKNLYGDGNSSKIILNCIKG